LILHSNIVIQLLDLGKYQMDYIPIRADSEDPFLTGMRMFWPEPCAERSNSVHRT